MNRLTSTPKIWPPAIKRVMHTVDRYDMFEPGDKVLVGVSGGPDSMALLHILYGLVPIYGLQLAVAHLNHGLRSSEADRDESFVKQVAEKLGLPFHRQQANLNTQKGSIEEQAREARYRFFREVMNRHGYTKIALGHQKNDNAEAVLLHLLRGSGTRGLAGIPPVRDRRVVRPLIQLDRIEIMAYLKKNELSFVDDATNTDTAFVRNRIRHHLIPLLEKTYNANILETLHRTADLCREEETWFNRHLQPLLDKVVSRSDKAGLELDGKVLAAEPLAVQRRLIRGALHRWFGHIRRMGICHIDAAIALIPIEAKGKMISLPNGITAARTATHLCFTRGGRSVSITATKSSGYCYTVPGIDCMPLSIEIPEAHCHLVFEIVARSRSGECPFSDTNRAWFDLEDIAFPIHIRNFRPGDRISPYGMQGSQKIKKLFIDRKIEVALRPQIPLLESRDTILWVVGIRRSKHAVVSKETQQILRVKVDRSG